MEMSSEVTGYRDDLVAKACTMNCVRPAGRYRGISLALRGVAQSLERATMTRGLTARSDTFEGMRSYQTLVFGWVFVGGAGD